MTLNIWVLKFGAERRGRGDVIFYWEWKVRSLGSRARVATASREHRQTNGSLQRTFMDGINILSSGHHDQLTFSSLRTSCSGASQRRARHIWDLAQSGETRTLCAAMSVLEESRPFAQQLSNVYFTILSLFCFKLFVKISLAILSHFYIVKGNRKEAARIAAEFYGVTQGQGMFMVMLSCFTWHLTTATATAHENIACFLYGLLPSEYAPIVPLEKHL